MPVLQRVVKPITSRGKRALLKREPKAVENPKGTLLLHGRKSSQVLKEFFDDVYHLKKPNIRKYKRLNDIAVFEDSQYVEYHCKKFDLSMFITCSHTKKRPHNVVFGRMFDHQLYDMFELGIDNFIPMKRFKTAKLCLYTKPSFLFNGDGWETNAELMQLKAMFLDFFYKEHVPSIVLQGIEHVMSFSATNEGTVLLRSYKAQFKKSGERTPRVELVEIGPRVDFIVRRNKIPSDDLAKEAHKVPDALKVTSTKNITEDGLGSKLGRVHLGTQDISRIQTRKVKGLRKTKEEKKLEKTQKKSEKRKEKQSDGEEPQRKRPKVK